MRMSATVLVTRLMRETEILRDENRRLRIALHGFDGEPRSPWPLLSGADIRQILHPDGDQFVAASRPEAGRYRAIARVTHQLASRARPAHEIKNRSACRSRAQQGPRRSGPKLGQRHPARKGRVAWLMASTPRTPH